MMLALAMLAAPPLAMNAFNVASLPMPAQSAYANYVTCLSEPLMPLLESGKPEDKAGRQALYDGAIAKCAPIRGRTIAEMDKGLVHEAGWTEATARKRKIEDILSGAEQRVHYGAVDREEMLARSRAYMACLGAKADEGKKAEAECTF